MLESMARLAPRSCASLTVRGYTEQHYMSSATAYHVRGAGKGAIGKKIFEWLYRLDQKWVALHFGEANVETRDGQHVFEVQA